jgi:ABC-type phosphate/phosphonate transport system substrate-binding protein
MSGFSLLGRLWLAAYCWVVVTASIGDAQAAPPEQGTAEGAADRSPGAPPGAVRIGAVAYDPGAVTVFEGLRRYLNGNGLAADYVLYSNYDALVAALDAGHVDIAWNTPLAHARYQRRCGNAGRTLVMRDVDCDFRSMLIVRKDAGITSLADLDGKTLVLGSRDAAEATVLPVHFLKQEGLDFERLTVLSLDREVDLRGNPCSSEVHVLKALQDGRGQAGVIGERLWQRLSTERPAEAAELATLWTSPPFSHCVFTARPDLDAASSARFTELMLAMEPDDPLTAQVMRLEGTRRWVAGSHEGFAALLEALGKE